MKLILDFVTNKIEYGILYKQALDRNATNNASSIKTRELKSLIIVIQKLIRDKRREKVCYLLKLEKLSCQLINNIVFK